MATDDSIVKESSSSGNMNDDKSKFPMSRTLRVSNLTRNVNEDHLHSIFSTYGELDSVIVKIDPKVKLSLGYGFVEFKDIKDAENAFKRMNNAQIDGKEIAIKFKELSIENIKEYTAKLHKKKENGTTDKGKESRSLSRERSESVNRKRSRSRSSSKESNKSRDRRKVSRNGHRSDRDRRGGDRRRSLSRNRSESQSRSPRRNRRDRRNRDRHRHRRRRRRSRSRSDDSSSRSASAKSSRTPRKRKRSRSSSDGRASSSD